MRKLMFYVLFTCAVLCGVPAFAVACDVVRIYMDGDSTMQGVTVVGGTPTCADGAASSGCTPNNYGHGVAGGTGLTAPYNIPTTVQLQMDAAFGKGAVLVDNHGVGGQTVLDSINGTGLYDCAANGTNATGTCGSLGARLQASHAQIVVGQFLTNDQYRMTPAQMQTYVATWINTVQALRNADGNPMIAIWNESAPICRLDAPDVGPYLTAMRTAAANANVMLVGQHDYIYQNLDWLPMLSDCVHPDNGLYVTMGNRLATAMGRTVQVLLGR